MSVPLLPPLRQPKSLSLPVLRQPKSAIEKENILRPPIYSTMRPPKPVEKTPPSLEKSDDLLVPLKNGSKLIVSSDSFHGILNANGSYYCGFCEIDIKNYGKWKELHKFSHYHNKMLENSTMSVPRLPPLRQPKSLSLHVLRQPKSAIEKENILRPPIYSTMRPPKPVEKTPPSLERSDDLLVTLKNGSKLIVSSDSFHGILNANGSYYCAFCEIDIKNYGKWKELHKFSHYHNKMLENSPPVEVFYMNNFIRPINPECYYCTTCNAIVGRYVIIRHLASAEHCQQLRNAKQMAG